MSFELSAVNIAHGFNRGVRIVIDKYRDHIVSPRFQPWAIFEIMVEKKSYNYRKTSPTVETVGYV